MDGRRHLDPGTLLDAYRIVRVVGAGAFGVTYEATDVNLGTTIAIKEYFPDDFATRTHDSQVRPSSDRHSETFNWGRNGFLEEARTLARFRHPSIVQIYRIFEANSTAYMVMAFENGPSFERWLRGLERRPTQDELDLFLRSLLDALQVMHENNFLHRDIAPDNIIIRHDSTPVLLDFGAARKNIAAKTHMVTGIYKQGYSPQEQYSTDGKFQGPWSDFYALGATLYRAVTGMPPDESPSRGIQDTLVPAVEAGEGSYRRAFLTAIDACLKLKPLDRPQTAHEVRELAFTGTTSHQPDVPAPAAEARSSPKTGNVARPRRPWRLSSTPALALSAVAIAATYMIYQLTAAHLKDFKAQPTVQQKPQSAAIAPKPTLPTGNTLLLQLATGNVAIRLRPDIAPKHVERIKLLASEGFYNGMKFHRVIPNFVAQTGDPTGTGNGGSKYPNVNAEFSVQFFQRGTVGASRTKDPNSFNSQFFICTGDCAPLSFNYTILGEVVQGMEHVERLAKGEPPAKPDIIVTARIVESSGR